MPELEFAVSVVKELGVPVALVAYFCFKDWRFTSKIDEALGRITAVLEQMSGNGEARSA